MPDYLSNVLVVEGSAEDIADFRARFVVEGHFGFENVLPIPDVVANLTDPYSTKLGRTVELAVAALLKFEPAKRYPGMGPILEREAVKEAGIRSYEDLSDWLSKNYPDALGLGARAVDAYRKTGSCCRDDWCETNWGTQSYLGSTLQQDSATRIKTTFQTRGKPTPVLRVLATQCPRLLIRAASVASGHGLADLFNSERGTVVEEELPWTRDALTRTGLYTEKELDDFFEDEPGTQEVMQSFAEAEREANAREGEQRPLNALQYISLALLLVMALGFAVAIWNALAK